MMTHRKPTQTEAQREARKLDKRDLKDRAWRLIYPEMAAFQDELDAEFSKSATPPKPETK